MKHFASLLGVLAVAAMASAGQFGCAAGTTTTDVGDDDGTGSGDDDSGTTGGGNKDSGGNYSSDTGTSTGQDSGTTSGHDSGSSTPDTGTTSTPDTGTTNTPDTGTSSPDTGTTNASCPGDQQFTTQACQTCMDAECCSEGVACASDQDCQGLIGCLQSCQTGDTSCEDICSEEYSDAVQEYNDLGDCLTSSCNTQCGG